MGMLKEATEQGLQVNYLPPKVHCTVFNYNSSALGLARLPKMRPRTKHINQAFHHFREYVEHQEVKVKSTPTENQVADIMTKPLTEAACTTSPIHHGLVGPHVYEWKGVFEYMRKGAKSNSYGWPSARRS